MPENDIVQNLRLQLNIMRNENLVTVTIGGGGDGFHILNSYLKMLERMKQQSILPSFQSIIVTGPFLSSNDMENVFERAKELEIQCYDFFVGMENLIAASDIVVCMGGYNTICEVVSSKTLSLVIPREIPRKEQFIRAGAFNHENLIEFIPWSKLNDANLEEKILYMLENRESFTKVLADFDMTGIANICKRISKFRNKKNGQ